jgi:hypothetical protein
LLDLYNFSKPYHKKVKDFNSITYSKQACFAVIATPIFQEEGDGLLPLVTRCENSLFEENFLPKGCLQNKRGRKKERAKYIGFHLQT